jgi:hypothetical protein
MGPARLDVEQVGLHGGVAHLLGAPTAISGALQAIRNVVGQLLEHAHPAVQFMIAWSIFTVTSNTVSKFPDFNFKPAG